MAASRKIKWNPADEAARAEARAEFDRLRTEGFVAYRCDAAGGQVEAGEFDPAAGELLMVPALVGG